MRITLRTGPGSHRLTGQDGETGMSETQGLLDRIAALRQEPNYPASPGHATATGRLATLQKQVAVGSRQDLAADHLVRQASGSLRSNADTAPLPRQLTARMRRLLDQGRALVNDLRQL